MCAISSNFDKVKKESPNMGTKTRFTTSPSSPYMVKVKKESPNMGTKTGFLVPCFDLFTSCEKRIPKHGDENNVGLSSSVQREPPSEKRIPKHGDENIIGEHCEHMGNAPVKKESPNMGTKTPPSCNPLLDNLPVKKESPNMGTKTILFQTKGNR